MRLSPQKPARFRLGIVALGLFVGVSLGYLAESGEKQEVLRFVADVPLPGPPVRFDYQSLNSSDGRLYIAHMNADQLVVFDTKKREVVANLDGFHRVHGVIAVPELARIFASVTGDHQVAVV